MSAQENESVEEEEIKNAADNGPTENVESAPENRAEAEEIIEEVITEEINIEALQAQLQKETEQAQANLDLALRTQAEMENLRKRTGRDIENAHKYALEKFVNELLPIMDSLQLGMSAAESAENIEDLREGMDLTLKMFISALEKFGVKTIDPQGEKFNPEQHEAVSMQEVEGTESNTVVTVMQKGYELNGRLVRPAMVMVAK